MIYTTTFLRPPTLIPGEDKGREQQGFCYAIGENLPDFEKPLVACSDETNLSRRNILPPHLRTLHVTHFEWVIPKVAKGVYQPDGKDYTVTDKDVAEFAATAWIGLYCGGEKAFAEIVPASRPITFENYEYCQVMSNMAEYPLPIMRLARIWTAMRWNHDALPNVGGVVPVRFILRGE